MFRTEIWLQFCLVISLFYLSVVAVATFVVCVFLSYNLVPEILHKFFFFFLTFTVTDIL